MSVSLWAYTPILCDNESCPGDCDRCSQPKSIARGLSLEVGVCPYCT